MAKYKSNKYNDTFMHPNRGFHNWLIYKINNRMLKKFTELYKGVLYDFGCGEAPYKEYFLNYCNSYIGIDWEDSFHNKKADLFMDLNKPIKINSSLADTIVSLSVLEHLYEPQIMLTEAYRILKNDGYLILQVPFQWWLHEAPHDYYRYTPYGLKYLLEKAGFDSIIVLPSSGLFTTLALKFNYFTARYTKGKSMLNKIIKFFLIPIWFANQLCSPILDKLDKNWELESSGFWIVARKK